MPPLTLNQGEAERNHPDKIVPPTSRECAPIYWALVEEGELMAKGLDVAIVGLARNSMPWMQLNATRVEKLGERFKSWRCFIYENDSDDGTDEFLSDWAAGCSGVTIRSEKHDRPMLSHEKSRARTEALAEYRQVCVEWVRGAPPDVVIAIDFDSWGGWSDDGVMNGIWWLHKDSSAAGMASVSTIEMPMPQMPDGRLRIHYDSWAFRHTAWTEHDMTWFPHWWPPVGSAPVACRSAFGGLCIYRPEAYLAGTYSGPDCEHVGFHRSIREATGLGMYLNPSQRIVMNWIPEALRDGRQHGDD